MKESLLFTSLILFGIAVIAFILAYFMFHHLGKDLKFHKEKKDLPEKPFITNMQGVFATTLFAASVIILIIALMCY